MNSSSSAPSPTEILGVPKKIVPFVRLWVFDLRMGVLGVKNDSKNFGNKKTLGYLAKFWVNGPCFVQNLPIFMNFQGFGIFKRS